MPMSLKTKCDDEDFARQQTPASEAAFTYPIRPIRYYLDSLSSELWYHYLYHHFHSCYCYYLHHFSRLDVKLVLALGLSSSKLSSLPPPPPPTLPLPFRSTFFPFQLFLFPFVVVISHPPQYLSLLSQFYNFPFLLFPTQIPRLILSSSSLSLFHPLSFTLLFPNFSFYPPPPPPSYSP